MFLRKIIINGFKSFADRVNLTFERSNITGIVGPNGSGKSNVIDAVRWVMGEQNAKMLRGEKTTDIIFSGSEKRKSIGMAEVSLVFDNREPSIFCPPEYRHEEEITLMRRIYRDGEKEFLINQKPARMRDVLSFFAHTGLGGKSYSMIQQGQVDRVLQAKPEELRDILEEAAGTAIFKRRRLEAEKKIEQTQINLSRIQDILHEIEKQQGLLKDQSEKAEIFTELNDKIRRFEIELFANAYHTAEDRLKTLQNDVSLLLQDEVSYKNQLGKLSVQFETLQRQLEEADPELRSISEDLTLVREKLASKESAFLSLEELLSRERSLRGKILNELALDQKAFEALSSEINEQEIWLDEYREIAEEGFDDSDFKIQLEIMGEEVQVYSSKIEQLKDEMQNILRILDSNKIKFETLQKDHEKKRRSKQEQTQKLIKLEDEHSKSLILSQSAQLKVTATQRVVDQLNVEKSRLYVRRSERDEKLKKTKTLLDTTQQKHLEIAGRLASLEEIKANSHQGKTLAHLKEALDLFRLGDVLTFQSSDDLPQIITQHINLYLNRVLIRDLTILEKLFVYFSQQELAPVSATCLLKESTDDKERRLSWAKSTGARSLQNFFQIAKNSRLTAEESQSISERFYLLSPITNLENIPSNVIVIVEDQGLLTGANDWTFGTSQSDVTIDKNIEAFREQLTRSQFEPLKASYEQFLALEKTDTQSASGIEEELFEKNKELLTHLNELQGATHKTTHLHDMIITLRTETVDQSFQNTEKELEEFAQNSEMLKIERDQVRRDLDDLKEALQEKLDAKEEMNRVFENKRFGQVSQKAKAETIQSTLDTRKLQLVNLGDRKNQKSKDLEEIDVKLATDESHKLLLSEEVQSLLVLRDKLGETLQAKRQRNSHLVEELKGVESSIKKNKDYLDKNQKLVHENQLESEKIRLNKQNAKIQAEEKYNLDIALAPYIHDPKFNPQQVSRDIMQMRQRLEGLGPVNMMAIGEYKELKRRGDFIILQREEIVSSLELLQLAIEEIEENSLNRFMETFKVLNLEFSQLFPILFPRGEGQICLTDPEKPLTSGVEILVRLPGKSRQNMRLFSGGEKALTAIALIFSLLKSKPTPFCFLDEVDAPLDETNVVRFNRVLEALSDRFQFIVITHRRRTMEVLDVLYGVTMQEGGVSKMVGVDLTKDLPTHLQKAFTDQKLQRPVSSVVGEVSL